MFTDYSVSSSNSINGVLVWNIISIVVAILGGITVYFIFLKSNKRFNNFLDKLREFLNFKTLLIEDILKISYLILAIYITLSSFALIGTSVVGFFVELIVGNLVLRIIYELSILIIKICQNTSEINKKLK